MVLSLPLSPTWLILGVLGTSALALVFWVNRLKDFLMYAFVFTSAIDISKVLLQGKAVHAPGLSITLPDLSLLPLLCIWIFEKKIILKHRLGLATNLHKVSAIFLAWLWLVGFLAEDPFTGVLGAISYTRFFLIFIFVSDYVRTSRQVRGILFALGLSLITQALMVGAQLATGSPLQVQGAKITTLGTRIVFEYAGGAHVFRPQGFLGHPNVLADYCVFLLPVLGAMVLAGKRVVGSRYWMASVSLLIIGTMVLVVSLSRGGWVSFFVAGIFLLYVGARSGLVARDKLFALLGVVMVFCLLVIVVFPSAINRVIQRDHRSGESRMAMMKQAVLIIKENPTFGVGLGNYNHAAQYTRPLSWANLNIHYQEKLLKGIVHNKYLLSAAETGLVGLGIWLYLMWLSLRLVWRAELWKDPAYYTVAIGIGAAIFGQACFFLFDHFNNDVRIHYFWLFLGLLSALQKIQSSDRHFKRPAMV